MPDWPEAPRLEEALAEVADQIEPDPATRAETAALLALGEAVEVVPTLASSEPKPPSSGTRNRALAALTLAIVAATAWSAIDLGRSPQQNRTAPFTATASDEDPAPDDPPPPLLTQADMCTSTGSDAEVARLLDTPAGPIEVGVRSRRGTPLETRTVLVIGPGSDWRTLAEQTSLHDNLRATAIVYAAASRPARTNIKQTVDHLAANLCEQGPIYLLSIDNAMGADGACFDPETTSFSGFVFVNQELPPTACSIRRPTLVVHHERSPQQRDRWAQHMNCANPTTKTDRSSNEITAWATCRNTLVHLVTPSTPWTETIDDVPAADFIFAAISLAN